MSDDKIVRYVKSNVSDAMVPEGYEDVHHYKFFVNDKCEFFPCHESRLPLNCMFCNCPLYHLECPGEFKEIVGGNGIIVKDCSDCLFNHQPDSHGIINKILEFPIPWIPEDEDM